MKKPAKVNHLANWYFGNFCAKCSRIDNEEEDYARDCYDKLHLIADRLKDSGTEEMTHKQFRFIIKTSPFCKPIKKEFHECPICKKLGILQRRW